MNDSNNSNTHKLLKIQEIRAGLVLGSKKTDWSEIRIKRGDLGRLRIQRLN